MIELVRKPASATQSGELDASQTQTIPGVKLFVNGVSVSGNVRASEGAGTTTLTSDDNRHQIFNTSATGRICVLPTANIKAGEVWVIENRGAYQAAEMTISALNGGSPQELTVANGCNLAASIGKGRVILEALQDSPSLASHWRVAEVTERYHYATTWSFDGGGGTSSSRSVACFRHNNRVTIHVDSIALATTGTGSVRLASVTAMPLRFRPDQSNVGSPSFPTPTQIGAHPAGAQTVMGILNIAASGLMGLYLDAKGNTTWSNGTANSGFAQFGDSFAYSYINGIGG